MTNIADQVKEALTSLCEEHGEADWGAKGWTRRIKSAVAQLAKEGQKAYASNADNVSGGEWLYDLTLLDYSPETRILKRTILVLESEWSWDQREIEYDFHKLLLAKADLRVMVFQIKDEPACGKMFERLKILVAACEQAETEDRYLFSGWRADIRRFEHFDYLHRKSRI